MSMFDRVVAETADARADFLAIPLIRKAVAGDVPRSLYAAFLNEAYHHVRHTCSLLSLAAARTDDGAYRKALFAYLNEEQGHEEWILSDIVAITVARDGSAIEAPRPPCRAMVGYAYYAIEWISPYALLGMIHVLEGMSARLAAQAARALQESYGIADERGFTYLLSHGALDIEHVSFFKTLVDGIEASSSATAIIDCAKMMYWLYGNIFRDLQTSVIESPHVA